MLNLYYPKKGILSSGYHLNNVNEKQIQNPGIRTADVLLNGEIVLEDHGGSALLSGKVFVS